MAKYPECKVVGSVKSLRTFARPASTCSALVGQTSHPFISKCDKKQKLVAPALAERLIFALWCLFA